MTIDVLGHWPTAIRLAVSKINVDGYLLRQLRRYSDPQQAAGRSLDATMTVANATGLGSAQCSVHVTGIRHYASYDPVSDTVLDFTMAQFYPDIDRPVVVRTANWACMVAAELRRREHVERGHVMLAVDAGGVRPTPFDEYRTDHSGHWIRRTSTH